VAEVLPALARRIYPQPATETTRSPVGGNLFTSRLGQRQPSLSWPPSVSTASLSFPGRKRRGRRLPSFPGFFASSVDHSDARNASARGMPVPGAMSRLVVG
jgi:hypothetical protein